jgi:large subunit ribosomal protein L21
MFAVVKTGGKQYKVSVGDTLRVEKIDAQPGDNISLDHVLMVGDATTSRIGSPLLANSSVKCTVLDQMRDDKVLIYKKRRRQGYDRLNGHRQHLSVLYIHEIIENGQSKAKADIPTGKIKVAPEVADLEAKPKTLKAPKVAKVAEPAAETPKAEKKAAAPKAAAAKKETKSDAAEKKPAAKKTTKKES